MVARHLAALAVFALVSADCAAAEYAPGSQITIEGKVSALQSQRAFWLDVDDGKVLVFTTNAQQQLLYIGQEVRVDGQVSDDFIKVADVEVNARSVQSLRRARNMSASVMPNP